MGSQPTLDPAPTKPPDSPERDPLEGRAELLDHLQAPAAWGGHQFDHTHPELQRVAEQAFDRLNPEFGVPADQHNPYGRRAVQDREAALALGVRVAVHDARQNDRNPVIWQAGQDYRMADVMQAARTQPTRTRHGPERVGPER